VVPAPAAVQNRAPALVGDRVRLARLAVAAARAAQRAIRPPQEQPTVVTFDRCAHHLPM
jgi:hypothetical protein